MPENLSLSALPLCLTVGDPTGIGPEIAAKFLATLKPLDMARPLRIFAALPDLERVAASLALTLPEEAGFQYVDISGKAASKASGAVAGSIAYESLLAAVGEITTNRAAALVTGPISKENLQAAGVSFTGHTEILQHLARQAYQQPYQSDMLFVYQQFRMLLLTRHVALSQVSQALSQAGVRQSLENLLAFFRHYCQMPQPRLRILGVNPHAGEAGGDEESRVLLPVLQQLGQQYGMAIEPPVAADAAFRNFDVNRLQYDAYVAAYHDQGLIPFKMVAGLNAVNVTIGLPFLRTSVSHGTAPDIVEQGKADPGSLHAAYELAVQFTRLSQPASSG